MAQQYQTNLYIIIKKNKLMHGYGNNYLLGLSIEIVEYMNFAEDYPCHLTLDKYQQVKTDLSVSYTSQSLSDSANST